ncbi:hypothetical protein GCM10007301_56700 [Azorhizobium oxalatiphilum]|uniref:Response regulatory domain-containing protein n=1 Tax=Azorhizobium oxalatiphilum TaxID=980631 RepID=A0A917CJI5_9HYPH|nr:response regulator [Azorhizobium oxalatiphilum]GGF89449.1 hypothetical protein GCM10007301_56700 [Azorhizobium oxalatiphilum]
MGEAVMMRADPIVHVIDDDISVRESVCLLLSTVGFDCREYETVQDFLSGHEPSVSGCIVLDVRLPGMSGLEFQSRLGQLGITLPVVMMTGHTEAPMTLKALNAGAAHFLTKPFQAQEMIDAVSSVMASAK